MSFLSDPWLEELSLWYDNGDDRIACIPLSLLKGISEGKNSIFSIFHKLGF